jgi:hypothetical protein
MPLTLYRGSRFIVAGMDIMLLYFEDCPNWRIAQHRLAVLASERPGLTVTCRLVETLAEAERVGFLGSPSIQVDGVDLFPQAGAQVGLSCRRYPTSDGYEGAPTLEQLRSVLADA